MLVETWERHRLWRMKLETILLYSSTYVLLRVHLFGQVCSDARTGFLLYAEANVWVTA